MKYDDNKRERILQAAQACFSQYGFKRTSMDAIAHRADISRPALYLLFPNKEAIFRALIEQLHRAALDRTRVALSATGRLPERLLMAFEEKVLGLLELLQHSPHGEELLDLNAGIGAEITRAAQQEFIDLLTQAVHQAEKQGEITFERVGLDARQYAEVLVLAAHGFKAAPLDIRGYRQHLAQLIQIFSVAIAYEKV